MKIISIFSFYFVLNLTYSLSLSLCSTTNVGTDHQTDEYMSNGWCHDYCQPKGYSVGILQGYLCWCSNDVPLATVDMSNCDVKCPGFSEMCATNGYYGYLLIGQPSSTIGSSSQSTSSTSSSTSSTYSSTSSTYSSTSSSSSSTSDFSTTSSSTSSSSTSSSRTTRNSSSSTSSSSSSSTIPSTSSSESKPSSDSSSSDSSSPSTSSSSTSTSTSSPSISVLATTVYSITTVDGSSQTHLVKTQYITQYPTTSSTSSASASAVLKSSNSFFDSKGKVAGTFTAVGIVALGIILGILYCCCCAGPFGRHKNDDNDGYTDEESQISSEDSLSHTKLIAMMRHSKNGSVASTTPLKRDNSSKSIFTIFNSVSGALAGFGEENQKNEPVKRSGSKSKLNSPMVNNDQTMFPINEMDYRLDPKSIFLATNASTKSLDDDVDYSRRILKITNPETPEE